MCPMETTAHHTYVFTVERRASFGAGVVTRNLEVSVLAESHAAALTTALQDHPEARRIYLADIRPGRELCTDERCSVCYPSRRNGGR